MRSTIVLIRMLFTGVKIMKLLIFSFLCLTSLHILAAPRGIKEKVLDMTVELPDLYGGGQKGQIIIEHDENFSRTTETQPHQKIERFIYAEGAKEVDSLDPEKKEGTLISKEKLDGFIDTDLLKIKFETPSYVKVRNLDIYPVALKFRASLVKHVFKRLKLFIVRTPKANEKWHIVYGNTMPIDSLFIRINFLGQVVRIDLKNGGTLVKSLKLDEVETIAFKDF